jgi:hypothetical protein
MSRLRSQYLIVNGSVTVNSLQAQSDVTVGSIQWTSGVDAPIKIMGSSRLSNNVATKADVDALARTVVPLGTIVMWWGQRTAVPAGWAICDGTNGTPDLTDTFAMGEDLSDPSAPLPRGLAKAADGSTPPDGSTGQSRWAPAKSHLVEVPLPRHTHAVGDVLAPSQAETDWHTHTHRFREKTVDKLRDVNDASTSSWTSAGFITPNQDDLTGRSFRLVSGFRSRMDTNTDVTLTAAGQHSHSVPARHTHSVRSVGIPDPMMDVRPASTTIFFIMKVADSVPERRAVTFPAVGALPGPGTVSQATITPGGSVPALSRTMFTRPSSPIKRGVEVISATVANRDAKAIVEALLNRSGLSANPFFLKQTDIVTNFNAANTSKVDASTPVVLHMNLYPNGDPTTPFQIPRVRKITLWHNHEVNLLRAYAWVYNNTNNVSRYNAPWPGGKYVRDSKQDVVCRHHHGWQHEWVIGHQMSDGCRYGWGNKRHFGGSPAVYENLVDLTADDDPRLPVHLMWVPASVFDAGRGAGQAFEHFNQVQSKCTSDAFDQTCHDIRVCEMRTAGSTRPNAGRNPGYQPNNCHAASSGEESVVGRTQFNILVHRFFELADGFRMTDTTAPTIEETVIEATPWPGGQPPTTADPMPGTFPVRLGPAVTSPADFF